MNTRPINGGKFEPSIPQGTVPEEDEFSEMICHLCSAKHPFLSHYATEEVDVTNDSACKLPEKLAEVETPKALFLNDDWRSSLCRCTKCIGLYEKGGVAYLIDEEDAVAVYEEKHCNKPVSLANREIEALSSMDRITRTEVLHGMLFCIVWNSVGTRLTAVVTKSLK